LVLSLLRGTRGTGPYRLKNDGGKSVIQEKNPTGGQGSFEKRRSGLQISLRKSATVEKGEIQDSSWKVLARAGREAHVAGGEKIRC